MPDFAMCAGQGCEVKDHCYRHVALPSPHQTWGQMWLDPTFNPRMGCMYLLRVHSHVNRREAEDEDRDFQDYDDDPLS